MLKVHYGLAGRYKFRKTNADTGKITLETGWSKNLITTAGLNRLGVGGAMAGCVVGSGTTPPQVTDNALANFVARTNSLASSTATYSSTPPYYSARILTYRFAQGVAAGNLTEVGIEYTGPGLFSRALIVDENGAPITITVLANEVLDVFYEIRTYMQVGDVVSGPFNVLGEDYTLTSRAANAASGGQDFLPIVGAGGEMLCRLYAGAIGPETGLPTGASTQFFTTPSAYVDGSLKIRQNISVAIGAGNIGGVGALLLFDSGGSTRPWFQVGFSPVFPKDDTIYFDMSFDLSWGRYAP